MNDLMSLVFLPFSLMKTTISISVLMQSGFVNCIICDKKSNALKSRFFFFPVSQN